MIQYPIQEFKKAAKPYESLVAGESITKLFRHFREGAYVVTQGCRGGRPTARPTNRENPQDRLPPTYTDYPTHTKPNVFGKLRVRLHFLLLSEKKPVHGSP